MAKIWLLVVAALFWASGGMAAERIEVGGLAFAVPEGWRVLPPGSPMRKAELQAPGGGGVTFFHFGRQQGGTAEANIERWIRQFQEPPEVLRPRREVKRLGAIVVHHFRASGTYLPACRAAQRRRSPATAWSPPRSRGRRATCSCGWSDRTRPRCRWKQPFAA